MMKSSNTMNLMRKSDKAANNSHSFKSKPESTNTGSDTVITSNRFSSFVKKDKTVTNHSFHQIRENNRTSNFVNGNKNSFFNARKASICNGYNNVVNSGHSHHAHHHAEFHRSTSMGSSSSKNSTGALPVIKMDKPSRNYNKEKHERFGDFNNNLKNCNSCKTNSVSTSGNSSFDNYKSNSKTHSIDSSNSHSQNCNTSSLYNIKNLPTSIEIDNDKAAAESVKALETLQQIQEAKPGNKRALIVDLPPYLYSIPALASFFEPYGEVAMLQILPQKRMWDADLIDLLGASMCNRLANQSLCAIVEFYSARMAKFIIGILRKRLPILKFRCALLKPSAAIELTNQAENLGLQGVVVMKNKPKAKTPSSDSRNTSLNVSGSASSSSDQDHDEQVQEAGHVRVTRSGSSESGCEEMSRCSNIERNQSDQQLVENVSNQKVRHQSFGYSHDDSHDESHDESDHNSSDEQSPAESAGEENIRKLRQGDRKADRETEQPTGQRFVTSFSINLNR